MAAFVDAVHGLGMGVMMDVVLHHTLSGHLINGIHCCVL
jgi:1,4-alpha-glucan branching enzyme